MLGGGGKEKLLDQKKQRGWGAQDRETSRRVSEDHTGCDSHWRGGRGAYPDKSFLIRGVKSFSVTGCIAHLCPLLGRRRAAWRLNLTNLKNFTFRLRFHHWLPRWRPTSGGPSALTVRCWSTPTRYRSRATTCRRWRGWTGSTMKSSTFTCRSVCLSSFWCN